MGKPGEKQKRQPKTRTNDNPSGSKEIASEFRADECMPAFDPIIEEMGHPVAPRMDDKR